MIKSQNNQIQLKYLKVLRMLQFFFKGTCMDFFMYCFWQFKLQDSHNSIT